MTLRYPPSLAVCKSTHISYSQTHLTMSQTNFYPAHHSHFNPLSFHAHLCFISEHGAMSSLSTPPSIPVRLSHLLHPPAIYLLPPPLLQSHFENFPLLIPSLPSTDWYFLNVLQRSKLHILSTPGFRSGSQSLLRYISETRSLHKFKLNFEFMKLDT